MAWQRKTPFGYKTENGKIVPQPDEAKSVQEIYKRYLEGGTYTTIAVMMTETGVRYHSATPEWNKHMIKRILENSRYTGTSGLTAIIDTDVYNSVQEVRASKMDCRSTHSAFNDTVKRKLVCSNCGAAYKVKTSCKNGFRWRYCGNDDCGVSLKTTDDEFENRITALLKELADNPQMLDVQPMDAPLSMESERIKNEFFRELGKPDWDEFKAKSLAFACATERFGALGDVGILEHKANILKTLLHDMAPLTAFNGELFSGAVNSVLVSADGTLALSLISGKVVTEKETGEVDNHERTAC